VSKKNIVKVAGFIGTLGAGAALVATAATGTGAWFTDSQTGNLSATMGHLKLSTTDRTMALTGLMPGENRDKPIDYTVSVSSGTADIWLTFDTSSAEYGAFTGESGNSAYPDGGLGRYGHFAVANNGTTLFSSYNLANASAGVSGCANADGHGFGRMATGVGDTPPYCGVPGAIKLASNVADGQTGHLKLTFGITGRATTQGQVQVAGIPFQIVATQHGHMPGDANF
jgi:hypothetical protein